MAASPARSALVAAVPTVASQAAAVIGVAISSSPYAHDALGRLKVVKVARRFGQAVDADPSAPGVRPEATRYSYNAAR